MSKSLRGKGVPQSSTAFWIKHFARRCGATDVMSPHKGKSPCRTVHSRALCWGGNLEILLRRYESSSHMLFHGLGRAQPVLKYSRLLCRGSNLEISLRRYESSSHMLFHDRKAATMRQRAPGTMLFVGRVAHYSRGLFGSSFRIGLIKYYKVPNGAKTRK